MHEVGLFSVRRFSGALRVVRHLPPREARACRGADGSEMEVVSKGGSTSFLTVLNNTFLEKCVAFLLENRLTNIGQRLSVSCITCCRPTVDIGNVVRFLAHS